MSESPIVSIITPVYNAAPYLENTIKSVLTQTFQSYELILINDGSTDNSLAICEAYSQNYSNIHLFSQSNKGATAARRTGVEKSIGVYITFLDADDLLPKNSIYTLYKNSKKVDAVIGFNDDPIAIPKRRPLYLNKEQLINYFLTHKIDAHPSGKLWKRSLFKENTMNTPPIINLGEDLIMNIKLSNNIERAKIIYKQVCVYVSHEGQTTKKIKYNVEYETIYYKYLQEAVIDDIKYQKGIILSTLYDLKRITRFNDDNYNSKNIFVKEICSKALHYKLAFSDYVYIITKNNQRLCRKSLRIIAKVNRVFFHKYH